MTAKLPLQSVRAAEEMEVMDPDASTADESTREQPSSESTAETREARCHSCCHFKEAMLMLKETRRQAGEGRTASPLLRKR